MRNNIKDNFEAVYLRMNTLRKYIHKADPNLLHDREFKRCINYMTFRYFYANRYLFSINGFEREDLQNIITLYGLAYFGCNAKSMDQRGQYLCMMKFISQRMSNLINWIAKKFGVDEIQVTLMGKFPKMIDTLYQPQTITINGIPMWGHDNQLTNSEQLRSMFNRFDEINISIANKRKTASARKLSLHDSSYSSLLQEKKVVADNIATLQAKTVRRSKNKDLLQALRVKLADNPSKYSEQLSYYATSKHVGSDIRKAARAICNKYDINYKEWAKVKMNDGHGNNNDYTF